MVLAIRAWNFFGLSINSLKVNGEHMELRNPESDEGSEEMDMTKKKSSGNKKCSINEQPSNSDSEEHRNSDSRGAPPEFQ